MSRLYLALAAAAALQAADVSSAKTAAASPLESLNANLPSWVRLSGELRAREEGFLGNRFVSGNDDMYLLQRIRLGVEIRPAPWLKFFAQGQDARVSFTNRIAPAPPHQDSADLRQAYVELGVGKSRLLTLRAGRQELAFGEERLVGASNWGNVSRTFDAVRVGVHHGPYQLDAFTSSVVVARDHAFDRHLDADDLHGLYGQASTWIPRAKVEPFFFWRLSPAAGAGMPGSSHLDGKTTGVRIAGELPKTFEYVSEMALQRGSWAGDSIRAWAGFWRIGHEFSGVRLRPRLRFEANHASGDKNPADGKHGTFDVLYPTAHDKYGLADQVGWKNVNHLSVMGEVKPGAGVTIQLKAHDWWLASARDGLYNAGGALLVRDLSGLSGTHIGHEFDFQVLWDRSKHLHLGGGIGHMFPGQFLKQTTSGKGYTFPYVSLLYSL